MKQSMMAIAAVLMMAACHKEKNETPQVPDMQSVLVYVAGDNNLTSGSLGQSFFTPDLQQMMEGSKELPKGNNLILFVDIYGKLPFLMKVENGDTIRLKTFSSEMKSSDPETLRTAYAWMRENYAAQNYGLVLWGHAEGWTIWQDGNASRQRKAYGQDVVGGEQWMNIPDMARVLESVNEGKALRFIFADCCCFQCVESAYELRNCADYIIASAAEIPGEGAPYHTVIPALFSQRDDFYQIATDAYYEQVCTVSNIDRTTTDYQEPMAVVKTSQMDQLAQATRKALAQCFEPLGADGTNYPDINGLIYYYNQTLFDMNDVMLKFAPEDAYKEWRSAFDQAVVYNTMTTVWMSSGHVPYIDYNGLFFRDFEVTAERYGGISMYLPQQSYTKIKTRQNNTISQMQWYTAAGLKELGW